MWLGGESSSEKVQVCLFQVQDFPALATSRGQQLVRRLSRGVQIAGSSSQASPKPLQALASHQRRKHCSKKELQHHRRQQLHGPGLGGGEAAITLGGGDHRTLARETGGRSSGDPGGHGRLPASGCKPAWDLRGARGRWASLYSLRLSDRPSPSASSKRASCLPRAAPWVDSKFTILKNKIQLYFVYSQDYTNITTN